MEPDSESGLFDISVSDSEQPQHGGRDRASRNHQSEAAFAQVKQVYRTKIENGEMWQNVRLPLAETVSRTEGQELLHAVEELYFFRRFDEALVLTRRILQDHRVGLLDADIQNTLGSYRDKLVRRVDGAR